MPFVHKTIIDVEGQTPTDAAETEQAINLTRGYFRS